jgi:hypothetical protein
MPFFAAFCLWLLFLLVDVATQHCLTIVSPVALKQSRTKSPYVSNVSKQNIQVWTHPYTLDLRETSPTASKQLKVAIIGFSTIETIHHHGFLNKLGN